jgi:hypothetical protein
MVAEKRPDVTGRPNTASPKDRLEEWLSAVSASAKQLQQTLVAYRKHLASGAVSDPHLMATWLRGRASSVKAAAGLKAPFEALIEFLDEAARDNVLRLEADLREALVARGWKVDGQWPRLYVERVVRLEMDQNARRATVGEESFSTLNVHGLVDAVARQLKTLLPDEFTTEEFIETLARCYDTVASSEDRAARIWDVYRSVLIANQPAALWRSGRPSHFRPLSEQTFRACLTRLLESGPTATADGRELKLLPPLRPDDAMFLYLPAEQRFAFVGRMAFVAPAQKAE